ncbi:MaoC family dehydratase [Xanthobacter sp. KR7-225]|uniref:MaoC family dehydratase n=1 Tax=Xanthobacter sp. KR7-225 TaxID=3156613 RepID=UPI0032B391C0
MDGGRRRVFADVAVGEWYELSSAPITTRQLVMYAGASGDFNRIHYDQAYAAEAGLGGVIAHGMLTMGIAARCACEFGGAGAFVRDISGRFLTPVRPGEVVRMRAQVLAKAVRESKGCCDIAINGDVDGRQVFQGAATVAFAH